MIGSVKNIAQTLAIALCLGVTVSVWGCTAEDSPLSDCVPADTRCEGNVAIECTPQGGGKSPLPQHYKLASKTCEGPSMCFAAEDFAICSLSAEPCDGSFVPTCAGDRVVDCGLASKVSYSSFQIVGPPCEFGNTCILGGCGAPSDTKCDPMTHVPRCVNGTPTICSRMGNGLSTEFREQFAWNACTDGNQCLTGPGWVGCGRDGTLCKAGSNMPRCEGNLLIECAVTFESSGFAAEELEYQTTCPKGCGLNAAGVAECNP